MKSKTPKRSATGTFCSNKKTRTEIETILTTMIQAISLSRSCEYSHSTLNQKHPMRFLRLGVRTGRKIRTVLSYEDKSTNLYWWCQCQLLH